VGSIPGLGRSPGEGHGNPLQPGESPWTEGGNICIPITDSCWCMAETSTIL